MRSSDIILDRASRHHGLIRIADDPRRARTVRRMAAAGALSRLLPGVYCIASVAGTLEARARAVRLWDPNAVIVGRAAAALSFGVTGSVPTIDVMMAHWTRLPRGYRCHKGRVPVRERVDYQGATRSSAAWTAVWMAARDDGEAIETALRARIVTPKDLTRVCALMARKPGQRLRRFVVAASQHNPWSAAERLAHRILLDAGISDFQGNCQVTIGDASWPIDIAMTKLRLAMEIDGFEYHQDRKTFEWDHEKADRLVEEGWTVVRITWSMLQDKARFLTRVRKVMAVAESRLTTTPRRRR